MCLRLFVVLHLQLASLVIGSRSHHARDTWAVYAAASVPDPKGVEEKRWHFCNPTDISFLLGRWIATERTDGDYPSD